MTGGSSVATAMVLGAGLGQRLSGLGLEVPKVLVPVGGRPLLALQLDYLHRQGVERVVVNAHHRAEAIETFARSYAGPVELVVIHEPELLGTAGGVRGALRELGEDAFFVLYGDVVIDQPLQPLAEAHRRRGAEVTVSVYESEHVADKGTVVVDGDGWVQAFVEKDPSVRPPALINAGVYVLEPSVLAALVPKGVASDFGHDVFPAALASGTRILGYRLSGPVIDVGTPEGLAAARQRSPVPG